MQEGTAVTILIAARPSRYNAPMVDDCNPITMATLHLQIRHKHTPSHTPMQRQFHPED